MIYSEGTEFSRKGGGGAGWQAEVVIRDGHWVVLRVTHPDITITSWEVVLVRWHDVYEVGGQTVEAGEHLAGTNEWGRYGWTFTTREDAERKLGALLDRDAHSCDGITPQEAS